MVYGFLFILFGLITSAAASISVNYPLRDHMVLQRNMKTPISGTGTVPGEAVTVIFNGQNKATTVDSRGKWIVYLDSMKAGGPFPMEILGKKNSIKYSGILVGDVYFCSGQSNMANSMFYFYKSDFSGFKSMYGIEIDEYIEGMDNVRLLQGITLKGTSSTKKVEESYPWDRVNKISAGNFSATAFTFAKTLSEKYPEIPIGLIEVALGGTSVESWMPPGAIAEFPYMKYLGRVTDSVQKVERKWRVGDFYDLVQPYQHYGIAGVLWYQGEYNAKVETGDKNQMKMSDYYNSHFRSLIRHWRKDWNQGDFPFIYVQIARYSKNVSGNHREIRAAQQFALEEPNTAMISAMDLSKKVTKDEIHPKNKKELGERLVLAARKLVLGENVIPMGPIFRSMSIEGSRVRLKFWFADSGLAVKEGIVPIITKNKTGLKGFWVAGANKVFNTSSTTATIEGNEVVLTNSKIPEPMYVRYSWKDYPDEDEMSIYGANGHPLSTFSTLGFQLPDTLYDRPVSILKPEGKKVRYLRDSEIGYNIRGQIESNYGNYKVLLFRSP